MSKSNKGHGGLIALLTGMAAGAAAIFLSNEENRQKTKQVVKKASQSAQKAVKSTKKKVKKATAQAQKAAKKL